MDSDQYRVAERVVSRIDTVFTTDRNIDEFDIIPGENKCNQSPVIHVVHKLGLKQWCIPILTAYLNKSLLLKRNELRSESKLASWSRCALLINPDVVTFWNIRKDLIRIDRLDPKTDLHLTALILTYKPKSPETYAHRRWVLRQIINGNASWSDQIEVDFKVAELGAGRYPNNYHSWNHRIWIIQNCSLCDSTADALFSLNSIQKQQIMSSELRFTEQWIMSHISDYSGMKYRQFVLDIADSLVAQSSEFDSILTVAVDSATDLDWIDERTALRVTLFQAELNTVAKLLDLFACHESLWHHRRHSLMKVKILLLQKSGIKTERAEKGLCKLLSEERELVREHSRGSKMDFGRLRAQDHLKWLDNIFVGENYC